MKLVDSHCHLDFDDFEEDRSGVMQHAKNAGVEHIVIPAVDLANWHRITGLCANLDYLSACYGLHPYFIERHTPEHLDRLADYAASNDCVAIGEFGLDFREKQADRLQQQFYFETQLEIAASLDKPVIIHSVRATEQVIATLKHYPGMRGVVHSYSGNYQQAAQLLDAGFYLGVGCAVTYDRAKKLREVVGRMPLSSMLLETDAPDQPDAAHRGERNEPGYITAVAEAVATLREEAVETIAGQTTRNAVELFGIDL